MKIGNYERRDGKWWMWGEPVTNLGCIEILDIAAEALEYCQARQEAAKAIFEGTDLPKEYLAIQALLDRCLPPQKATESPVTAIQTPIDLSGCGFIKGTEDALETILRAMDLRLKALEEK